MDTINQKGKYVTLTIAHYERMRSEIDELKALCSELYTHIREGLEEGDEEEYHQKTLDMLAKHKQEKE